MTCRPLPHPSTAAVGILVAIAFSTCAIAQAPGVSIHVSTGGDDFTISSDINAAASANGPYQVPVSLDGQTYYMSEEGFDRFSSFTNFDDMTYVVRAAGGGPGPGDGHTPDGAPLLDGIMFDGLPIDVVFTNRDSAADCKKACTKAPDCLAFTYHPGARQCDMFWDISGEIADPCCVSGYLD